MIKEVKKRDGNLVKFDKDKITTVISKAMLAVGEKNIERKALLVSDKVIKKLNSKFSGGGIPHIEDVQDIVEQCLVLLDFPQTAKAYILYRNNRANIREQSYTIPEEVKKAVQDSRKYFQSSYEEFIFYRSYSRWRDDKNRRETWVETVDRYIDFMYYNIGPNLSKEQYEEIREAILTHKVMPSMRLLWSAGKAARENQISSYNCSYIAPCELRDFAEIMFILMSGTGVGFSVESINIQELPIVRKQKDEDLLDYIVEDSKEGWADALLAGLEAWYSGKDIKFNLSKLRPYGARLKTMGGRSSGPDGLNILLDFTREIVLSRQGKRLRNIDVYDIICKIGEAVVMGGVRRSALISLSDLDDKDMRDAKRGQFYLLYPHRSMANNSAVYNEKPNTEEFLEEFISLMKSGSGERGIFNRYGLKCQLPTRRKKFLANYLLGTNPCSEIWLRHKGLCNLTEVVARKEDTLETLIAKIEIATILGTYQSMITDFKYLSKEWKKNAEEERLLGVSITGMMDCPLLQDESVLTKLKEVSIATNKKYAQLFGITQSLAINCVKPSGTVSQLVNASSGIHPRYSKYYIRRVRISGNDPLFHMLKDQKFPYHPEVGQELSAASTYVIEFPIKSPEGAITRNDLTAIQQLEYWKKVKINYTEHNPSCTIFVDEDEWISVADWLYKNWDIIGGLSFLPKSKHVYSLAPYEEITEEKYNELIAQLPTIDFSRLVIYEQSDNTEGSQELACSANQCEI